MQLGSTGARRCTRPVNSGSAAVSLGQAINVPRVPAKSLYAFAHYGGPPVMGSATDCPSGSWGRRASTHRLMPWWHKKWVFGTNQHEHRNAVANTRADATHAHAAIAHATTLGATVSSGAPGTVAHAAADDGSFDLTRLEPGCRALAQNYPSVPYAGAAFPLQWID